jgi:hypothetical protein
VDDTPIPFLHFSIRVQPFLSGHKILVRVNRHRGGESEIIGSGQFAPGEWSPEEIAAQVCNDLAVCVQESVEWMMWMDAERPL